MKNILQTLAIISITLPGIFAAESCTKAKGCMDKTATNFNPLAEASCPGCCNYTDPAAATTGNALFYSTETNMPTITLSNGMVIIASSNTGCTDAHSSNHIALPQGNYSYTAANITGMKWHGNFLATAGQCNNTGLTTSNASVSGNGMLQFSTNNSGLGSIAVTVNGSAAGTISPYIYSSSYPGPGFDVSTTPGTHSYTAQSSNGQKWAGTIEVTSGKNTPISFSRDNMLATASGSSNIVFYSTSVADYSVSLNSKNIGSGIANSSTATDVCSQKWEVSTVVPFGTYKWSATTTSGKYFSGTVVANSNGCVTVQIM